MPFVHIEWFPGRTVEQKRELAAVLTEHICRIASCEPDSVEIVFTDVAADSWSQGGRLSSDPRHFDQRHSDEPSAPPPSTSAEDIT